MPVTPIPTDCARGKLFYAFLELIEKKPYNKIKVSELIEKAGVNRSTFYRYYSDIFDYYDRICRSGLFYITNGIDTYADTNDIEASFKKIDTLLSGRIDMFADMAKKLTGKNGRIDMIKNFRGYLLEKLEAAMPPENDEQILTLMFFAEKIYARLLFAVFPDDDLSKYDNIDFPYDPKKGALQNVIDALSRGNGDVFNRIMSTALRIFIGREPTAFNVRNITNFASVSRTEFYNFFGSTRKMLDNGLAVSYGVCAQMLFEVSTVDECDFLSRVPGFDLNTVIDSDTALELIRRHREYYLFSKNCILLLNRKLKKHLSKKGIKLTPENEECLQNYCIWSVFRLIEFSERPSKVEFKEKILWAKNRLAGYGIAL